MVKNGSRIPPSLRFDALCLKLAALRITRWLASNLELQRRFQPLGSLLQSPAQRPVTHHRVDSPNANSNSSLNSFPKLVARPRVQDSTAALWLPQQGFRRTPGKRLRNSEE